MSNIKPFDLNLVVKGEEISVKYLFDLDKFSIQVMYSYLSRGKLYEPNISSTWTSFPSRSCTAICPGASCTSPTSVTS